MVAAALIASSAAATEQATPAPAAQQAKSAWPPLSADAIPEVDNYLREQAKAGLFSGAVLISQDGKPLLERGYGLANRETGEPVTPDTRFNLASINKFITRIAIYQLLDAGKLSLDDKVGKILPDYPNAAVRDKVTVQHLIDMKGGLPDIFNEKYRAKHKELRTTDDFLALFAEEPLRFEPGMKREYSNGGYIVLGKIVEQLSGTSYSDYVKSRITGPTGMTATSLDAPNGAKGAAIGYTRSADMVADPDPKAALRSNQDFLPGRGSSAGGGYSSVRDFARLDEALRSGKLLKPATRDLLFPPGFAAGTGPAGLFLGGTTGSNTLYLPFPGGATVIVFANMDPPAATSVMSAPFRMLGRPLPGPPPK
jgi:CubicO group peptidase (beta-lactamase class C family)